MTTVIHFKSDKALNFLLKNGICYTIRPFRRKEGKAWVRSKGRKVAIVNVEYVGEVIQTLSDEKWWVCNDAFAIAKLKKFVKDAGVTSVEEWLNEVKKLNRGKLPENLYLYRVTLLEVV